MKGLRVVGYDLEGAPAPLAEAGLIEARSVADFRPHLSPPRRIFLYIPAGPAVDSVLADLASHLERGDVVVDGGNSY